jgi:hypothetical protein
LLLLALVWLAGCASHSTRFYPLGIYDVRDTNDFSIVREAGFNLITGPADGPFLDAAKAHGLKVMAAPGASAGPGFQSGPARRAIQRYDAHPALWAWYLVDEPEMTGVAPEYVLAANRFLKSLGARKPTSLVLYHATAALSYVDAADILLIDRYPIPWLPLADFPKHLRLARSAAGKNHPLIAVIQAFDWAATPNLLPQERHLRPPSYEELRCLTYCALVTGANGLFYYAFDNGPWKMEEHLDTWYALHTVIQEVTARLPLFRAQRLWWPAHLDFHDYANRFNAALESSVMLALLRVPHGDAAVPSGHYVLAVNNTTNLHVVTLSLPGILSPTLPVFSERRALPVQRHGVTDVFPPYAVHVYGPLDYSPAKAGQPK